MKKYTRWIFFGAVVLTLGILLIVLGTNNKLRQKIAQMVLELQVRNTISDLKEKAAALKTTADNNQSDAIESEKIAKELQQKIIQQKQQLQQELSNRGLSADEIADRFNKLNL